MKIQKLYFVTSTFPPQISGVGDYTAYLATELAKTIEIKVLIASDNVAVQNFSQFKVEKVFSCVKPQSFFSIIKFIREDLPDWLIIQYDPFGYGMKFGLNPYIPLTINILKITCPQVRIGIIVHESFVHNRSWKLTLLGKFLETQLWLLGYAADAIFTVIDLWAERIKKWFPNKLVKHIPVSSNIPKVPTDRTEIRESLGILPQTIVLGLFGRFHRQRRSDLIINAVHTLQARGLQILVMYIGHDCAGAKSELRDLPLLAEGPFSSEEISRRFAAIDIYLVPIDEGVSTRNTSFMVGLQHGIPTIATFGISTDSMLMQENGKAFLLTDSKIPDDFPKAVIDLALNPLQQQKLSDGAKQLFEREFSWPQISSKLLTALESFQKDRESL